ncbi:MAG: hypothetical protein Q8M31_19420 [Beijerinckiaceae bacterium]|nr:hypothetical protein [Beijerinckiaceae bacterium]
MGDLLWIESPYAPWSFLLVTVTLGGAAAFAAGRVLAQTWRPMWQAFAYAAALAAAVGFLHFVLFDESVIPGARMVALLAASRENPAVSLAALGWEARLYGLIFVTLCLFAAFGYRLTRVRAMKRQYGFDS